MNPFKKLILLTLFFTQILCAQNTIRVYIMAGQSNMTGTANPLVSGLPADLLDSLSNVRIKVNGDVNYNWQALRPGLGATSANFGPELTFGRDAPNYFNGDLHGDKIAIIKFSHGSTTLNEDWRPPSSGGTVGWLYTGFINDLTNSLATLDSNYQVEIMGICWMQGEYDALDITKANNYQTNLSNFISDIRAQLNLPQLPFVIGMIDDSYRWTYRAVVRQAETTVAKNTNAVSIFDTKGLGTDGIYYNMEGQLELGHFFFSNFSRLNSVCSSCNDANIKVFPNPSMGSLNITYSDIATDYSYKIRNMQGAEVLSGKLYIGYEVDISTLAAGTYFIYLTTNKTNIIKKLIKI